MPALQCLLFSDDQPAPGISSRSRGVTGGVFDGDDLALLRGGGRAKGGGGARNTQAGAGDIPSSRISRDDDGLEFDQRAPSLRRDSSSWAFDIGDAEDGLAALRGGSSGGTGGAVGRGRSNPLDTNGSDGDDIFSLLQGARDSNTAGADSSFFAGKAPNPEPDMSNLFNDTRTLDGAMLDRPSSGNLFGESGTNAFRTNPFGATAAAGPAMGPPPDRLTRSNYSGLDAVAPPDNIIGACSGEATPSTVFPDRYRSDTRTLDGMLDRPSSGNLFGESGTNASRTNPFGATAAAGPAMGPPPDRLTRSNCSGLNAVAPPDNIIGACSGEATPSTVSPDRYRSATPAIVPATPTTSVPMTLITEAIEDLNGMDTTMDTRRRRSKKRRAETAGLPGPWTVLDMPRYQQPPEAPSAASSSAFSIGHASVRRSIGCPPGYGGQLAAKLRRIAAELLEGTGIHNF